jgi:hypothetical protein
MCVMDLERCSCSCHEPGMVMAHMVACCESCPYCYGNIVIGAMERHKQKCHLKPQDDSVSQPEN